MVCHELRAHGTVTMRPAASKTRCVEGAAKARCVIPITIILFLLLLYYYRDDATGGVEDSLRGAAEEEAAAVGQDLCVTAAAAVIIIIIGDFCAHERACSHVRFVRAFCACALCVRLVRAL